MNFFDHLLKQVLNLILIAVAGFASYSLVGFFTPGFQYSFSILFIASFAITYLFLGAYLNYLNGSISNG